MKKTLDTKQSLGFKKKIIATAVASALLGGNHLAQAQTEGAVEEVVVTGIRASLQRAMDIKREAAGVVDAISAEDIGKMPDTNLAESLQRITGVSIDRSGGEGSRVTVRGLAGDYNLVTLNGRQMPSASSNGGNIATGRSFDFSNLASEGVAGVEVYKTGRADIASGGMGALINILTTQPLRNPGLNASVGVKGVYDESREDTEVTPEVSGIYSNTFADDTIGVALTASYQSRESGSATASVPGWFVRSPTGGDWGAVGGSNGASGGRVFGNPVQVNYSIAERTRDRLNSQLTVQYKPADQLTVTADYLYVEQEVENQSVGTGFWFDRGENLNITWDAGDPSAPLVYRERSPARKDNTSAASFTQVKSDLKSAGLNLKWDASEHLTLEFDAHNSTSYSGPNGKYGTDNSFTTANLSQYDVAFDFSGDFPIMSLANVAGQPVPNASNFQVTGNTFKNSVQDQSVDEYQLKGVYSFDDSILHDIRFGVGTNEVENKSLLVGTQMQNRGSWGGVGNIGEVPTSLWKKDRLSNYFDASGVKSSIMQDEFLRFDWKEMLATAGRAFGTPTPNPDPLVGNPCAYNYCATLDPVYADDGYADQKTLEESSYAYIQLNLKTELASMPTNLSVGVRHEATDVTSTSILAAYDPLIQWDNGGNEYTLRSTGRDDFTDTGSYNVFLPSLDFDISFTETIKGRLSLSKTMARPNYDQIKGGRVYAANPRKNEGSVTSGNPDLNPLQSENFDMSVEWYFDDASYVSVGYFRKDLKDFIGSTSSLIEDSDFRTPVLGARWNAALAALGANASDLDIRNYIHANYPATTFEVPGSNPPQIRVFAVDGDPILPFRWTRPTNNRDGSLDGFEVAVQHTFGESGYGVMVNATKVDSDVVYDVLSRDQQFAIDGLSDSANFIGFYDKDGLQVRLAYNWRDEFKAPGADNQGNPIFTEAYGQVDGTVSYDLTDNLTISLEVLNLLDEHTRQHGRAKGMLLNYTELGARYNLGARYTF